MLKVEIKKSSSTLNIKEFSLTEETKTEYQRVEGDEYISNILAVEYVLPCLHTKRVVICIWIVWIVPIAISHICKWRWCRWFGENIAPHWRCEQNFSRYEIVIVITKTHFYEFLSHSHHHWHTPTLSVIFLFSFCTLKFNLSLAIWFSRCDDKVGDWEYRKLWWH